jgi:protein SCO1/2
MRNGIIMRRPLQWGLLILLVAMGGGLTAWPSLSRRLAWTFGWSASSNQSQGGLETLGEYGEVPDFALTERGGRQVTRADLRGKVWIVEFFYTECPDTCPLQSANMARLQDALAQEPDVRLVSISVDPEHDTLEVLAAYATRFGADPDRWLFLTGAKDAIYRLAVEGFHLGVVDRGEQTRRESGDRLAWLGPAFAWAHPVANADRKLVLHSSRFLLVDRQAQIRGYYHGTDWESLDRLRANVKIVLRERSKKR